MAMLVLAFLGGILTIVSPCILPVLPFVFARADQPFRRSGLPLLAGMALTFAAVAAAATAGGGWVVRANQYGRMVALAGVGVLGLTLVWPGLAERLSRPFVRLGSGLAQSSAANSDSGVWRSLLLGVGTGLLWAPCAGPILGLVLTGAALQGGGARTVFLLLSYAAGASVSLAVALLAGGRLLAGLKRSLKAEAWVRVILGLAVLAGAGDRVRPGPRGADASLAHQHVGAGAIARRPGPAARQVRQFRSRDDDVFHLGGQRVGASDVAGTRGGRVAEFRAARPQCPTGARGPHRFLDVFVHQLPSYAAVHSSVGGQV